jgi:hypothetical protein
MTNTQTIKLNRTAQYSMFSIFVGLVPSVSVTAKNTYVEIIGELCAFDDISFFSETTPNIEKKKMLKIFCWQRLSAKHGDGCWLPYRYSI